jgi:hypothetical protein
MRLVNYKCKPVARAIFLELWAAGLTLPIAMPFTIGSLELFLETKPAADIWIELHRTIRERNSSCVPDDVLVPNPGLSESESRLYSLLTQRFIEGLTK